MILPDVPKYYWDACIWIELISRKDRERFDRCSYVIELAENGEAEIWTSAFTLAEVWKRKCAEEYVGLQEAKDRDFENYIEKEFIKKVSVDVDVGSVARRLLRKYPGLGKPQDAIHVATALLSNVDELHTFDGSDLLRFDGKLPRLDKIKLHIQPPPERPKAPQAEMFPDEDDQHDGANSIPETT